jgi:cytochrome P450
VEITRADEVRAILGDPEFLVPPAPAADGAVGVAWLRASVGRFANGEAHARRRALGAAALARIDCASLEREACARAGSLLETTGRKPFDLMARIARPATVEVLAEALGLSGIAAADVALAARAYPGAAFDKKTDAAVERLVATCGGAHDEATAASIGLLVQACDATAGLAANALIALLTSARSGSPAALVSAVLRDDPPVRTTRRIAQGPGRAG